MTPHLLEPPPVPPPEGAEQTWGGPAFAQIPPQWAEVARDLEVDKLVDAMADGDDYVRKIAGAVLAAASGTGAAVRVRHRQDALRDVLAHTPEVRELYRRVIEAIESRKQHIVSLDLLAQHPGWTLHSAIDMLQVLLAHLQRLREFAKPLEAAFASVAFRDLFAQLRTEIDEAWMAEARTELTALGFRDGMLFGASLGAGNHIAVQVLYAGGGPRARWWARLLGKAPPQYGFRVHPRDEAGTRALSELSDRAINEAANALAQATEHVFAFLDALRGELAFFLGCARLHERLTDLGVATCVPEFGDDAPQLRARALRDPTLALTLERAPADNDVDATAAQLLVVTGANQGGKSTFLRALGLAQLMLQAGMFVAARSYAGRMRHGIYTHHKREEDAAMRGGKLDEELVRISAIADWIEPGALWLSNESFASTNEREGSQILLDVVEAFRERDITVYMVTHLFDAARRLASARRGDALFLRAPRAEGGLRSYRLEVGAALDTSFGADVYAEVFGRDDIPCAPN